MTVGLVVLVLPVLERDTKMFHYSPRQTNALVRDFRLGAWLAAPGSPGPAPLRPQVPGSTPPPPGPRAGHPFVGVSGE